MPTRPLTARKRKTKAGKIEKATASVTTADTPLPLEEIIVGNPHAMGDKGDVSSADMSRTMFRASRAAVARIKRDMEKNGERMDSMEATLNTILERLTPGKGDATEGGTAWATDAMMGRVAPGTAEGSHDAAQRGDSMVAAGVDATKTSRDAPGEDTQPATQGRVDAEVSSQQSAQTSFEYRQRQLRGAVKYKRGLAIQRKKVKMAVSKKL